MNAGAWLPAVPRGLQQEAAQRPAAAPFASKRESRGVSSSISRVWSRRRSSSTRPAARPALRRCAAAVRRCAAGRSAARRAAWRAGRGNGHQRAGRPCRAPPARDRGDLSKPWRAATDGLRASGVCPILALRCHAHAGGAHGESDERARPPPPHERPERLSRARLPPAPGDRGDPGHARRGHGGVRAHPLGPRRPRQHHRRPLRCARRRRQAPPSARAGRIAARPAREVVRPPARRRPGSVDLPAPARPRGDPRSPRADAAPHELGHPPRRPHRRARGVVSARFHNSALDQTFMGLALVGLSIPNFLLGLS